MHMGKSEVMTSNLFQVKDLLEVSDITSCLGFENDSGLVAPSAFTCLSESALMSFHLLCIGFLIHVFLLKNIYFT